MERQKQRDLSFWCDFGRHSRPVFAELYRRMEKIEIYHFISKSFQFTWLQPKKSQLTISASFAIHFSGWTLSPLDFFHPKPWGSMKQTGHTVPTLSPAAFLQHAPELGCWMEEVDGDLFQSKESIIFWWKKSKSWTYRVTNSRVFVVWNVW